jgi:uncharacterized protein (TIGR02466 family)
MSNGRKKSNVGGWQSNDIQDEPELENLVNEINLRLDDLSSVSGLSSAYKLRIINMWININPKYSYNANHIHNGSFFSGSYYIKVPENSGTINFVNPSPLQRLFVDSFIKEGSINSYNRFNAQNWTMQPQENMLILFPSWIEHNVGQNISNDIRISIAFNTVLQ